MANYEMIPCPLCEGTGRDPAGDPDGGSCDCPECQGVGEVEDDSEEDMQ